MSRYYVSTTENVNGDLSSSAYAPVESMGAANFIFAECMGKMFEFDTKGAFNYEASIQIYDKVAQKEITTITVKFISHDGKPTCSR